MKTGQLIKELRTKKGLTQEELARRTELTARTIQRIENGEVDPRSYTLQMIANALEVDISVLTEADSEEKEKREMENERTWLGIIHLSGILLLIFPTIMIWNRQKDTIKGISDHFWDIINFQLSNLVVVIIPGLLSLIFAGKPYFFIMILIVSGITSMMNAMKVFNGRPYKYFYFFKFKAQKKAAAEKARMAC